MKNEINKKIHMIIDNNDLDYSGNPMVVVFRNTNLENGKHVKDMGENAPDGIVLYSSRQILTMQGRTKPNKSYLDKFFADGILTDQEKFNYVAPSYSRYAFKKGGHYGHPALIQNRKGPIVRSLNEIIGDGDDYPMFQWPCDNFHGWLKSLGCWSVAGNMKKGHQTGDWKKAHKWVYVTHGDLNNFDALCLTNEDWENPEIKRLRFGSKGDRVRILQEKLNVKVDGDFGWNTLKALNGLSGTYIA